MIYSTDFPYTVPSPKGKAAGVVGDGRLHMVYWTIVPDGANSPVVVLRYTDPAGNIMGQFADQDAYNISASAPRGFGTWISEPVGGGVNFVPVAASTGFYYASSWMPGGFKWLPAGTTADVFSDSGAATFSVLNVWVEDFGGLAQGDEFDAPRRTELPQLLLREG